MYFSSTPEPRAPGTLPPAALGGLQLSKVPGIVAGGVVKAGSLTVQGVWWATKWTGGALRLQVTNPAAAAAARAHLWQEIKHEALHYWLGSKLLAAEIRTSAGLLSQLLRGKELTRRERQLLKRILNDMVRMVPLIVILIVPFAELALPVLLKLFPNLLPSQFEKSELRQDVYKRSLHTRMELHGILGEVLSDHTARLAAEQGRRGAAAGSEPALSVKEVMGRMEAVRRGAVLGPDAIVRVAAMFRDDAMADTLPRGQLATLAKYLGLSPYSPDSLLRMQLRKRLSTLKEDDLLLYREGTVGLTKAELKAACDARAMRSIGLTEEAYRTQLDEWLLLSVKHDVSATLLLLSRSFLLSGGGEAAAGEALPAAGGSGAEFKLASSSPLPSASPAVAAALQESISAIDAAVVTETVLEATLLKPQEAAAAAAAGAAASGSPTPAAAAAAGGAAAAAAAPLPAAAQPASAGVAQVQLQLDSLETQNAFIQAEAEAAAAEAAQSAAEAEASSIAAALEAARANPHAKAGEVEKLSSAAAASEAKALEHRRRAETASKAFARIRAVDAASAAATSASSAAAAGEQALLTSLAQASSLGREKAALERMQATQAAREGAPVDPATAYLQSAMAKLAGAAEKELGAAEANSLQSYLQAADVDKDGTLTEEELALALAKCKGVAKEDAKVAAAALIRKLDTGADKRVPIQVIVRYLDSLLVAPEAAQ